MLRQKVRDAAESVRHSARPDDLYTGLVDGMHIDPRPALFLQLSRQANVIRVMMSEHNRAQVLDTQFGALQRCRKCSAGIGCAHTCVNERPAILAGKRVHIDSTQWERNRQRKFPDARHYLARLWQWFIRPAGRAAWERCPQWRFLHAKILPTLRSGSPPPAASASQYAQTGQSNRHRPCVPSTHRHRPARVATSPPGWAQ